MMQEYTGYKHTLVATLGGEPQIVTFTLDLLLKRGIPIYEVIVIHPAASPRIRESLERLHAEFIGDRYLFEGRRLTIHFRQQVLNHYEAIIDDIIDEATANGTLDTIGALVRGLKRQQQIIHFSISGGRRLMTFLSFSAALLYFETSDELLHLYTPEEIKQRDDQSRAMHITPGDGRRLIEVPFARAAQPFFALMLNRTLSATIQTQQEQQKAEEHSRCRQVLNALNKRSCDILFELARGLHPHEVATMLDLDQSTISYYSSKIYRECRNVWDVPEEMRLDYHFVQAKFSDYQRDR
jgi:CRISPR-associated protein Csx14